MRVAVIFAVLGPLIGAAPFLLALALARAPVSLLLLLIGVVITMATAPAFVTGAVWAVASTRFESPAVSLAVSAILGAAAVSVWTAWIVWPSGRGPDVGMNVGADAAVGAVIAPICAIAAWSARPGWRWKDIWAPAHRMAWIMPLALVVLAVVLLGRPLLLAVVWLLSGWMRLQHQG